MYDLVCEYFGSNAVNLCCFLLLLAPLAFWWIAVRPEGEKFEGYWKYHCRKLGKAGATFGVMFILFLGYAEQKYVQQQAQQQAVIELFTSVSEALGSFSETLLRNWLTPEEKKSRLLPVGLATNDTAWVAESQCVTSQVREAWQRVPIRRAAFRQTLPFPVTIGDNSYEEVFISSSGVIGFDAPKGSELTREMPYEQAADHVYLALLWGRIDFKPRLGSKMWCGVKEDGNFVASYDTVFVDGDTNAVAKVQVEFIANGDMILRYADLPPCSTNAHRAGFQNLNGGWTLPFDNIRSNTALYLKSFGPLDLTVQDSDTDGDGISDYYELYPTNSVSITNPCNRDSDGDGLTDGEEVSLYVTDPGAFSSDASGEGDLWRVLGGLSPSDAPYTNATPSGSVGILTVTTVLEGGTTNGGAVLRIADQYIPVLFGTTLVSRIAVPRDATNLFILARGVNCDNAIAHVTMEASTFTKIRDPSGVFGWSFALSPSCVTASGTILMPSYTITPELICFHSLTSKVCRISSADPDIYFVTSQGYVREYTPTAPEIQTNSFEIGSVPIHLACMDTALFTRASVTNIPAHLCNPDTGFDDEYPDGEKYSTWCKFRDGEHVWAEGYGPTNCPCIVFTNTFECICSGDGRKPCPCAHAVSDPKAMPLNADQTNVLGHASLVIGGTNDLLQVTVPEGTYRPCPLCACARGEPSSASVYRQTSCIEVTPGSLTASGAFSVIGISPSTNFADTVFMYRITDYSGAQAVTSYTRKDYTVLGTSVYPTDPGHSVSNWFIGCNVTNALTLWTGVKLPSDTGDVTLSVTVESGTPMPLLYVYNRIAQTNELLVTHDQLTFTQNLGNWRDNYCDTNGYVQAYLLCTSNGVGRVAQSFSTYPELPYQTAISSEQKFIAWQICFEPITAENDPILYNPCGIATNDTGFFKIAVFPENTFSDDDIVWSVIEGDLTFVNDNNKGRLVQLKAGTTTNEFKLEVAIQKLNMTTKPHIEGRIISPSIIPAFVWIVRKSDGSYPAVSLQTISNRLISANNLLRQVAIQIEIREINYTNNTQLLDIAYTNDIFQGAAELRSITNNTGGIEIYFVREIIRAENEIILGLEDNKGIILSSSYLGNYKVMAHEILHSCGLRDIYVTDNNMTVEGDATAGRLPFDWGGGFYSFGSILQEAIIKRTVMNGQLDEESADIPKGAVFGVWYEEGTQAEENDLIIQIWQMDLAPIGLDDIVTRQPIHE